MVRLTDGEMATLLDWLAVHTSMGHNIADIMGLVYGYQIPEDQRNEMIKCVLMNKIRFIDDKAEPTEPKIIGSNDG